MSPLLIVILALVAIGLVSQISNPVQIIIPVAVLGAIFLLYKFPPGGARSRQRPKAAQKHGAMQNKPKARKNVPFRVIEGGKDDDNLPKYH
ncbi:hypothetical protein [Paenibacillus humicola]|uniref:hypothetical protein n=1 Tax=Paenibacillus humicola TaxID=3110540 RepID=UPI00237B8F89|nr:hypothetical protein [Paenibacillus humicola]